MIDIQLDSVRKSGKSSQEYRYVPRARWKHLELAPSVQYYNPEGEHSSSASQIVNVVGEDWIVRDLCRLIAADNPDFTGLVHVFRGDTLCFTPMPLKSWVKHNPFAGDTPEQLRKDKT